jgi:hypothetical protein
MLTSLTLLNGCFLFETPPPAPQVEYVVSSVDAPVPEGVVRQCWEQPKVSYEKMGPGLDSEGNWYHPAYTAVREVKMGRCVPCEPEKR